MRLLIVGDPHVRADDIEDCENLLKGVLETAKAEKPDFVLFLGDLFHNHSIVHLTVLNFWHKWFTKFKEEKIEVIALKGNHDFGLSNPDHHALEPFKELAMIVDKPTEIGDHLFLPYFGPKRANEFNEYVKKRYHVVFCHETFDGAQYDNGFYAPDGMDQRLVNSPFIISGHIHTKAVLNGLENVLYYPGSPRWMTASDANKDKDIYLLDTKLLKNNTFQFKKFSTDKWCHKLISRDITSLRDISDLNKEESHFGFKNTTVTLTLKGTRAKVAELLELVQDKGFLIKQVVEKENVGVKESVGVKEAYVQFLKDKLESMGYDEEHSNQVIKGNLQWMD